jgi:hypothetical protein
MTGINRWRIIVDILTGTLAVNSGSSAATGLALAAGSGPLSSWFDIPTPVSVVVGVGLLIFAVDVARTARDPKPSKVRRVIASDVAWVVGAAIVIFGYPQSMSNEGLWALGVVTVAVAVFATLQTMGLRRATVVS